VKNLLHKASPALEACRSVPEHTLELLWTGVVRGPAMGGGQNQGGQISPALPEATVGVATLELAGAMLPPPMIVSVAASIQVSNWCLIYLPPSNEFRYESAPGRSLARRGRMHLRYQSSTTISAARTMNEINQSRGMPAKFASRETPSYETISLEALTGPLASGTKIGLWRRRCHISDELK
jgi:hypothetical protein